MENYSVLMTVYHKEKPEYFTGSIQSMLSQTIRTNDFVVICDGPLTKELDAVLENYLKQYPGIFTIIRLPENVGIGAATNAGLQHCKNDLVAKMDADDLSVASRCEKQLEMFGNNPELMVVGGYIEEFDEDPEKPFAIRNVPLDNAGIRKYAKRRQPFNNQTVMYRRSAVQAVGGYGDLRRSEDYDLYIRLLKAGCYAQNIPQVLAHVRVDNSARSRRASLDTMKGCARSRWRAFRIGYSSLLDFLICVTGEFLIAISPGKLQHFIYCHLLRKECDK